MRYLELLPPGDLTGDIRCLWELDQVGDGLSEPIFPDGHVEVVVHLGRRPREATGDPQPEVMVVGQMTAALRLEQTAGMHAVGIRFTPAGARKWLELPLSECTNRILPFDAVNQRAARAFQDALHRGGGLEGSRDDLETALRHTRRERWSASPALGRAVAIATASHGLARVDSLSAVSGLSVRQLERQFLEQVGLGPKRFTSICRLQRALTYLREGLTPVDVAQMCGFADQAHLARQFRRVAGAPAGRVSLADVPFLPGAQA